MQQSGRTYLETIYLLKRENGRVKSIDVAKALGFSKPSVSRAMGKLKAEGYLEVGEKGELILTKEGNKIAKELEKTGNPDTVSDDDSRCGSGNSGRRCQKNDAFYQQKILSGYPELYQTGRGT